MSAVPLILMIPGQSPALPTFAWQGQGAVRILVRVESSVPKGDRQMDDPGIPMLTPYEYCIWYENSFVRSGYARGVVDSIQQR